MTFETRSTVALLLIAQHDTKSRQMHREYRIYPIFPVKVHGFFLVRETPPAVFLTIAIVAETKFLVSVARSETNGCTTPLILQSFCVRCRTLRTPRP